VSWNTGSVEGPQGPIGLAGVDGETGSAGIDGADGQPCTVAEEPEGTFTLTCPNGESVSWTGGTVSTTTTTTESPIGPETCDGVDNDNNGQIDDGLGFCFNGSPADHTDGDSCDPGFLDLDGVAANGCEAAAGNQ